MQPRSRPLYDRDGSEALERAAPSLDREIAKAKGVILDRRRAGPAGLGKWGLRFAFGNYIRDTLADLADRPLALGTYRYRVAHDVRHPDGSAAPARR
jgi:hypothetical protein